MVTSQPGPNEYAWARRLQHDTRTDRHRQPETYQRPQTRAYPCQLAEITYRLMAIGLRDRTRRLHWLSAVTRRRIPALQALSMSEATAILITIGRTRGLSEQAVRDLS